jgi:DNA-binding NarL/FixJ family response regulator
MRGTQQIWPESIPALTSDEALGAGVYDLTPRELSVLALIARGVSYRGIAEELVVTIRTVEEHVNSIFLKLSLWPNPRVHRRVQAARAYELYEHAHVDSRLVAVA